MNAQNVMSSKTTQRLGTRIVDVVTPPTPPSRPAPFSTAPILRFSMTSPAPSEPKSSVIKTSTPVGYEPAPPVQYSNRPDAFTLIGHLLPALLTAGPLSSEAFIATLNRLTDTPSFWMNAFLFHPNARQPFVAQRVIDNGGRYVFRDATSEPFTGTTVLRQAAPGTRRELPMLRKIEVAQPLGDALIIVREPSDVGWKDRHMLQCWALQSDGRTDYDTRLFSHGSLYPANPPDVLDSPEAHIPNTFNCPTFVVLSQRNSR